MGGRAQKSETPTWLDMYPLCRCSQQFHCEFSRSCARHRSVTLQEAMNTKVPSMLAEGSLFCGIKVGHSHD